MSAIITVHDLSKQFGSLTAVDHIDFEVLEGDLFAFLGPNGAGKTTTINIICTLLSRTTGQITVDGLTIGQSDALIRQKIGVVFQDNVLDELLTVEENLVSRGALYGLSGKVLQDRLAQAAQIMDIQDLLARRYGKLSGGQRRRAEVARALMNDPRILFLDEPTTGLDPQTRIRVWQAIRRLQEETHMTVFLTTHYMEEAAEANQVAIIDHGKLAATGSPADLKAQYSTDQLRLQPREMARTVAWLTENHYPFSHRNGIVSLAVKSSLDALSLLNKLAGTYASLKSSMAIWMMFLSISPATPSERMCEYERHHPVYPAKYPSLSA